MKKIMIIAAVAFAAFCSHAATVTWSAANIQPDPTGNTSFEYLVYLVDNSAVAQSDMAGYLANGDTSYLSKSLANGVTAKTSATANTAKLASTKSTDTYTAGDSATYYLVILNNSSLDDATYFQVSNTKSGTVTAAGALTMGFGTQANNTWTAMAAVPEPTSGLLMLVGLAGLALRRKRA